MFTRDELRAIPLFSDLSDKDLDHRMDRAAWVKCHSILHSPIPTWLATGSRMLSMVLVWNTGMVA